MPRERHLQVDPWKPLAEEPGTGHNRWHEQIPPALSVDVGDVVVMDCRDGYDGVLTSKSVAEDVPKADVNLVHALTGPVLVKGAEPGDLLDVTILDVEPDPWEGWGYTIHTPGLGFLREYISHAFIAHWKLVGRQYAESEQVPGVRIPFSPFPGVIGVAPSKELRERAIAREAALAARGEPFSSFVLPPEVAGAVPADEGIARAALRTIPPRENGGNVDIKQLTPGAHVLLPVYVPGALFSVGDVHYAQGDSEADDTALEMRARVHVSFSLHKGAANAKGITGLQFHRDDYFAPPQMAAPQRLYATTGFSVHSKTGENYFDDVTLAARNALLAMVEYLTGRGFTTQQAYVLCGVAVDLRISETPNLPNPLVTAILPLDIFVED